MQELTLKPVGPGQLSTGHPGGFVSIKSTEGKAITSLREQKGGSEAWIRADLVKPDALKSTYSDPHCYFVVQSGVFVVPSDATYLGTASVQEGNFYPTGLDHLLEQSAQYIYESRKLQRISPDYHGSNHKYNLYSFNIPDQLEEHIDVANLSPE